MTQKSTTIGDLQPNDLVTKLGISRSYASELLKRKKEPSLDIAVRIEREFGIPASSWLLDQAGQGAAA